MASTKYSLEMQLPLEWWQPITRSPPLSISLHFPSAFLPRVTHLLPITFSFSSPHSQTYVVIRTKPCKELDL